MKKRRVQITLETEELIISRSSSDRVIGYCPSCDTPVRMVGLEEAMVIAGAGSREIHRRVEAGRLHFKETEAGHLLICLESLSSTCDSPRAFLMPAPG